MNRIKTILLLITGMMCLTASLPNIDVLFDDDKVELIDQKETSEQEEDSEKDWFDDSFCFIHFGLDNKATHVTHKELAVCHLFTDVWSPPPEMA